MDEGGTTKDPSGELVTRRGSDTGSEVKVLLDLVLGRRDSDSLERCWGEVYQWS